MKHKKAHAQPIIPPHHGSNDQPHGKQQQQQQQQQQPPMVGNSQAPQHTSRDHAQQVEKANNSHTQQHQQTGQQHLTASTTNNNKFAQPHRQKKHLQQHVRPHNNAHASQKQGAASAHGKLSAFKSSRQHAELTFTTTNDRSSSAAAVPAALANGASAEGASSSHEKQKLAARQNGSAKHRAKAAAAASPVGDAVTAIAAVTADSSQADGQAPATVMSLPGKSTGISSNWEAIKKVVGATGIGKKRKLEAGADGAAQGARKKPSSIGSNAGVTSVVAMDCEMVGVGPGGVRSALARVCLVNNDGNVLLDRFVKTKEQVTDYRTHVSGIRPHDLTSPHAIGLEEAQEQVARVIKGAILVGHAIHNDLAALLLDHPRKHIRDTSRYPPLMRASALGRKPRPQSLRMLAQQELGLAIQEGEHSPVDDARAALYLYHKHRKEWEHAVRTGALTRANKAIKAASMARRKAAAAARAAGNAGHAGAITQQHAAITMASATATLVGNKLKLKKSARKATVEIFSRDIRDDPMADL